MLSPHGGMEDKWTECLVVFVDLARVEKRGGGEAV